MVKLKSTDGKTTDVIISGCGAFPCPSVYQYPEWPWWILDGQDYQRLRWELTLEN